uniref:Uncharacterized protein n=1 Tax=Eutreptiella gymnastica TaxID=73025 RepID=A0A7S1NA71_9EUGL|mmetsp:Transcript_141257/g.246298  ORF Transcript_141257/g.246298 Transcript_141257/m.246298 type:complete len:493 (+) Transcript_141257:224-1702(+)
MGFSSRSICLWCVIRLLLCLPRLGVATDARRYLPAPRPRNLSKSWPFERMNDQRPFWYQCEPLSQHPETYPPSMPCLQQAAKRLEWAARAGLPMIPVSFCTPRRLVTYYHERYWNATRNTTVMEGLHGGMKKAAKPTNPKKGQHGPAWVKSYAISDETEYIGRYATSHFVITKKKDGWDAIRHNEILLAASIPVFRKVPQENTGFLFHYPMECNAQLRTTSDAMARAERNNEEVEMNVTQLREGVFQWYLNHLTCDAMVHFMFRAVQFNPCTETPILFLDDSVPDIPDYLSNTILIGLLDVLGPEVHIWKQVPYLYVDYNKPFRPTHGNGFGYAFTVHPHFRRRNLPVHLVKTRLREKYYKAVVYGNYGRSIPFWHEVVASLPRNRIWAINGQDQGITEGVTGTWYHRSGQYRHATLFVREQGVLPARIQDSSEGSGTSARQPPSDPSDPGPTGGSEDNNLFISATNHTGAIGMLLLLVVLMVAVLYRKCGH